MKKGWKIFWIICASILGAGFVLCIIGTAMGATLSGIRSAYADEVRYRHGMVSLRNEWNDWDNPDDWSDNPDVSDDIDDYEDYYEEEDDYDEPEEIQGELEEVSNFTGIKELDVELDYLKLIVREGDGDDIKVDASGIYEDCRDYLVYGQEDGTLKIEDQFNKSLWKRLGRKDAGKLIIEVPKDRALEDVSLEIGAGEIEIKSIKTGCLDLDVGAGQAIVKQFETKDLNVDCGAGQVKLNGDFTRKAKLECGVGDMDLTLAGRQKDYDYELKSGLGEIKLGGSSFSGLGFDKTIKNNAGKLLTIDCSVGTAEVSFAEKL